MRAMRCTAVPIVLLAVLGLAASVALAQTTQSAPAAPAATGGSSTFSVPPDVRALFDNNCVKCHGGSTPAAGHNFSTDADLEMLVGKASAEKDTIDIIAAGHPEKSYLVMKIRGAAGIMGSRMPLGGKPLSDKEIGVIETWIKGMSQAVAAPKAGSAKASSGSAGTPGATTKSPGATQSSGSTSKTSMAKDPPPPDPQAMANEMFDGAYVFNLRCADCHGAKGQGVTLFGPPLAGDAFIKVSTPEAIGQVINMGRKYRDKEYPEYMGMPRFQFITGGELLALIDYLKGPLQGAGK